MIVKSRTKTNQNEWLFDEHKCVCEHALTCPRVQNVRLSVSAVAALPSVREQFRLQASTAVRLQVQNTLDKHGLLIPNSTMSKAVNRLKGAEWILAQESLQGINKLLEAFALKNPGSRIVLERSAGTHTH